MIGHDLGLNYPKPAVSCQIVASLSKERKTLGSSTWHEDCGVVWVAFRIMCVAMAASPYPPSQVCYQEYDPPSIQLLLPL